MKLAVEWVNNFFATNDFASGGLVLALMGSMFYTMRSLPWRIWTLIRRRIIASSIFLFPPPPSARCVGVGFSA